MKLIIITQTPDGLKAESLTVRNPDTMTAPGIPSLWETDKLVATCKTPKVTL